MVLLRNAAFVLFLFGDAATALFAQEAISVGVPQIGSISSCRSMKGMKVPATALSLPTAGAYVRSARLVHDHRGEYCKVLGGIRPVDSSAQDIRFEVNLPTNWNHKAVQFGGGTFDGRLGGPTSGLKRGPVSVATQPEPLARGFATFGGDSGHHKHYFPLPDALNAVNASFARNAEERQNFAHDGLKKTHDAAVIVMERRYGMPPSRMFFLGGSTGGREAYSVMQRWPEDYDGVLGAYAGWNQIELDLQYIRVSQAMYTTGGYLTKSKTRLLAQSVMKTCDAQDGVRDNIIGNVAACRFDPATLLCRPGTTSKHCFTPQELRTVQTFATEQRTAQPLWNGVQTISGFNVLAGADLTGSMGFLHHPERRPKIFLNSFYYFIGDRVLRFFLTGDDRFNALTFNTTTGGEYAGDLLPQSRIFDASDTDLTRFAQHGGKFLMLHGTTDTTIPTNASVMYYKMVQSRMSQEEMDDFLRFYLIPGFGHGRGVFKAGVDALGVLDRWLDTGVAPDDLVVVDNNKGSRGRTRPLCVYPTWPKYKGAGDVNAMSSFVCATE
jgi:feruloyl esterase